ncbi:helix-turn-helix domain-containing protein [Streptomyces nigrescens]
MSTRPLLTQIEAAEACGVSRTTIRRRRTDGVFPGAVQDPKRGWMIPIEDLLAAGFHPNAPRGAPAGTAAKPGRTLAGGDQEAEQLRAELQRLQHEHELELERAKSAQKLAETEVRHLKGQLHERGQHIESLQRALAALTPAPERAAIPSPAAPAGAEAPPVAPGRAATPDNVQTPARRRWWGGRR